MNVLHFISFNATHPYFVDMARHLNGGDVKLFIGGLPGRGPLQESVEQEGIETVALDCTGPRGYPLATLRLARWLRQKKIDVVHAHLTVGSIVGLSAARLAGVRGRVVTRHHSDERIVHASRKAVLLDQFIGRFLARHVVALSNEAKRALLDIDRLDESKIRLVPTGYDWGRFHSTPEARHRVRAELGLEGCLVICHVGSITWVEAQNSTLKGQDRLLRAFAAARLPDNARVLIVGRGAQDHLKRLAEELGISALVLFLGHRTDAIDVMAASDLLVHPSLTEAQCHVLIEAMALGVPVVSSTVGAAREMITPGENGWLFDAKNQDELVKAMRDAIVDPERTRRIGLAGQRSIKELYPVDRMVKGYAAIYREELG